MWSNTVWCLHALMHLIGTAVWHVHIVLEGFGMFYCISSRWIHLFSAVVAIIVLLLITQQQHDSNACFCRGPAELGSHHFEKIHHATQRACAERMGPGSNQVKSFTLYSFSFDQFTNMFKLPICNWLTFQSGLGFLFWLRCLYEWFLFGLGF